MKDIALHLRQESKRTDLPLDVIRTLCEAYAEMIRLEEERNDARREVCELSSRDSGELDIYASDKEAKRRGWNCYKSEETL
jgi:hypothetical protein